MQEAHIRITQWLLKNDPTKPLDLSHLYLTELPDIPTSCQSLMCNDNLLTKLPALPNCKFISCNDNNLKYLPDLPNCELLRCNSNKLIVLPELRNCKYLFCFDNKLTYLPRLPNCIYLEAYERRYLYVHKRLADQCGWKETPNYNKSARIIQRIYKKYIRKKYNELLISYLLKGPVGVVCLYVI
jgi:hypothetical protein